MHTTTIPAAKLSTVQPTELDIAWTELARAALGMKPTRIVGEADHTDARNLQDDLAVLARHVDRVVLAYGRYAKSNLGISQQDVDGLFTNTLERALDGNAMFALETAGQERSAGLDDNAADAAREFRRA